MTTWRAVDLIRLTAGVFDLTATRVAASTELGSPPHTSDVVIYRVLGVRQVAQAWLTAATGWGALGAVVDGLHLASMAPVALLSHRWRRAALAQMGIAGTLLVLGLRER